MNGEMNLDWLGFTWIPNEETYKDFYKYHLSEDYGMLIDAFYDVFPEIHDYVMECTQEDLILYRPGVHYSVSIDCCDYFWISYDTSSAALKKGVNIQVPSHGLFRFFEIMNLPYSDPQKEFYNMIGLLYSRGCQLSRIDLCFDDFDKTFRAYDYFKWHEYDKIISCKFRCVSYHCDSRGSGTTYFGKERSDKFLRIYDKFLQSDGLIDSVRYEFELHGKPCKELGEFLLDNDFNFGSYLIKWFKVLDPSNIYEGTNRANSPLLPEWETWLNLKFNEVPTPIKIPKLNKEKSIYSRQRWIQACKWAIYTTQVCQGVDPVLACDFLGISDPKSEFNDIPLKYKRLLIANQIDIPGI